MVAELWAVANTVGLRGDRPVPAEGSAKKNRAEERRERKSEITPALL